jgi:outer membrane protein assembly factor BamB
VANGVVYFASEYQGGTVYALDASTGALLLQYTTGTGGFQLSSPAIVNGMLYIGSEDGDLYAFGLPDQQMSEKFSPPERPDPARLTPDWSLRANTAATPSKK